jgi:hypothetical protein
MVGLGPRLSLSPSPTAPSGALSLSGVLRSGGVRSVSVASCPELCVVYVCVVMCVGVCVVSFSILGHLPPFLLLLNIMICSSPTCSKKKVPHIGLLHDQHQSSHSRHSAQAKYKLSYAPTPPGPGEMNTSTT